MDEYNALSVLMEYTKNNKNHSFKIDKGLVTLYVDGKKEITAGASNLNKIVSGFLN
jgi:hypothetical protein